MSKTSGSRYSHSRRRMARPRRKQSTPRKTPRQQRSRATVEAVLTAAAQVFEARGYAAGTTNRIAERAGVSVGTLYQYFPNKEAIAVALLERHLAEGQLRLQAWVGRAVADLVVPVADDTPAAWVHGQWFFAHDRLVQIGERLDDLGWTVSP